MNNNLEIAIIGMSCRLPGAKNSDEFWNNLQDGVEAISFFNEQELLYSGVDAALLSDSNYVKAKGILSDIELFDAEFFGFSPKEAEIIDPQHRIFLESAWEAIENAGYDTQNYQGSIAVYAGTENNSYLLNNIYPSFGSIDYQTNFQTLLGNEKDYLSTRISYKLNLKGPSVVVQTACSTSLVAIHLACQSLLNGECDIALAGGVSVTVPKKSGYLYQEGGVASPDGHCRAFDAKAKGAVFGNGIGIVVLKRLTDAIAQGDCIHAIVKGSAINNDGSLKLSYTAPSIDGQTAVISEAQSIAGIPPETITYIEAHGTGTNLGDPIEIAALTEVFRTSTSDKAFCAIGSVKTNCGHLGSASGVTGLIKTVLALKHKMIPPSLHFEQPNPEIDFDNSPFYVNTQLSEWKTNGTPRRAGVSSFGVGGTNAHIILEEAPAIEPSSPSRPYQLLLISAKTSCALETATANLANHFQLHPDIKLADAAYTLAVGRRAFDYRRLVVCQNTENAINLLESLDPEKVFTHTPQTGHRPVVFMFPGQGSQYLNMGRQLYEEEPTFQEHVDTCAEILKPHLGLDIRHLLYPNPEQIQTASEQLQQTAITQVALFVTEYAVAQLWMKWGIHPTAMIGHSIGEYVAATIAGVFSLSDALFLVATRGKLMQQLPPGRMLAVPLPYEQVSEILLPELSIAAINTPNNCVVSGSEDAVAAFQEKLLSQGVDCRQLHTSGAFHSHIMSPILTPFTQAVNTINLQLPQIPFISNVTGSWITDDEATNPHYWATHLRQTVRFAQGLELLLQQPTQILLEVGPGWILSKLAGRHPEKQPQQLILNSLPHPQQTQLDMELLYRCLGQLWLHGVQIDWSGFYHHQRRDRLPLPTYPFERQRYWIEPQRKAQDNHVTQVSLDKKPDIADWFYQPIWKPSVLPVHLEQGELTNQKSWTLVFMDESGLGEELVKQLSENNQQIITVEIGTQFQQISEKAYTLNPQQTQ
ncbi:MAG: type I polyketide synthase, partial [Desmonostoc geniculatum HA4340-LM1]|nr:type I polyketide synthase [Desmonostoc geniculatum HA4340-LM1]